MPPLFFTAEVILDIQQFIGGIETLNTVGGWCGDAANGERMAGIIGESVEVFDYIGEVEFFLGIMVVDHGDAAIKNLGPKKI